MGMEGRISETTPLDSHTNRTALDRHDHETHPL